MVLDFVKLSEEDVASHRAKIISIILEFQFSTKRPRFFQKSKAWKKGEKINFKLDFFLVTGFYILKAWGFLEKLEKIQNC